MLVVLFLCVVCVLAQQDGAEDTRIASRLEASPKQFPYVVYVNVSSMSETNGCTGSILTVRWVLTAAHCFAHASKQDETMTENHILARVTAGALQPNNAQTSTSGDQQMRNSVRVVVHYSYDLMRGDIGLIELESPFQITQHVQPISLVTSKPSVEDSDCLAVGFGASASDKEGKRVRLLYTKGRVVACEEGKQKAWLGKDRLCFKNSPLGCGGDSGGPLICEDKMAGVLQGSYDTMGQHTQLCSDQNDTQYHYISTHYYAHWINEYINKERRFSSDARTNNARLLMITCTLALFM